MPVLIARDIVREPLYVIVPVSNAWRWKSRYKHTDRALKHFHDSGAVIYLVEAAFNRREAVYADSGMDGTPANCRIIGTDAKFRHRYIGLRSSSELWLKECLINRGVQELPHDWMQVAWLDSDVHFARPNWVGECIQKLQHYSFIQPFTQARDLAPNYEMLPETYPHANGVSFVQSWHDGDLAENLSFKKKTVSPVILSDLASVNKDLRQLVDDIQKLTLDIEDPYYGGDGPRRVFPGLAWAATRKAWDDVGGLVDFAIWGGADWAMSHALVGRRQGMMHTALHPHYKAMANEWADRADKYIRQNVGAMEGAIFHNWHGKKTVRGYGEKHRILARVGFDPLRHLKRDSQGLWQLHDDGTTSFTELRDEMRRIAKERNEDSIDI